MKTQPLSNTQLSVFFDQMAMVLHSGLPAMEGLEMMKETPHRELEPALVDGLYESLLNGMYLWQAMEESSCFPSYACHMMQIGEDTGHSADTARGLADFYRKEEELRQSLRGAVTYPLIMIVLMVGVLILMITQVLPIFRQIFRQLGSELTGLSGAMAGAGSALGRNSIYVILVLVLLLLLVLAVAFAPAASGVRRKLGGYIKPLGRLQYDIGIGRFAEGLSLMLMSGFAIDQSVEQACALTDHPEVRSRAAVLEQALEEGQPVLDAFRKSGLFSEIYLSMLLFGIRTGQLDTSMQQIADSCQQSIDRRISALVSMLEPTLVIVICVITGALLLSVMLPLAGILSGLSVL